MITVKTLDLLKALPNPEENEYGIVEDEKKVYQYVNNEWQPIKVEGKGLEMTLFDLNQSLMNSLPVLDEEGIKKAEKTIYKFINRNRYSHYFALISFEAHYVTLFHRTNLFSKETASEIIKFVQEEIGEIKDVSNNGHNAIEIWNTKDGISNCYLLFNYDLGVVEI